MTEEDKKPFGPETVEMTFERLLCLRHGETFRPNWPRGYPTWMLMAWVALDDLGLIAKATEGHETKEEKNRAIEAMLDEEPACCRLGPEGIYTIWLEIHKHEASSPWKRAICFHCKKFMVGGRFQTRSSTMGHQKIRHLCLRCILFKMVRDPDA